MKKFDVGKLFIVAFVLGSFMDLLFPLSNHCCKAEALVAAAAIAGAAALISGLLGGSSSNKASKAVAQASLQATRETNDINYKMFQESNQFGLDMWNRENEYNTPSAQVQRLMAAGLNPYLMLNGGSTGNAGSLTSATPAQAQTADLSALQNNTGTLGVLSQGLSSALNGLSAGIQMYDASQKAKVSASDAKFADVLNAANLKLTSAQGSLTHNQARSALSNAIVDERTIGSRIVGSQLDNDIKGYQRGILSTQDQVASQDFAEKMRNNYFAYKTLNDIEVMRQSVNGMDLDNKYKQKQLNWYDTLQQKGIDAINSNIKKNLSDIERNNSLNGLTNSQTLAQDIQNAVNGDGEVKEAARKSLINRAMEAGPQSFGEYAWSVFNDPKASTWQKWKAGGASILGFFERAVGGASETAARNYADGKTRHERVETHSEVTTRSKHNTTKKIVRRIK